jgi:hypothetical protein
MSSIYFIRSGETDWVKIGRAVDVKKRIGFLQVGNPEDLTLLATIDGGAEEERALHFLLRGVRRRGEWFHSDHLVRLLLGLVEIGFDFARIEAALTTYREAIKDLRAVKGRKGTIRKHRQGLVDPQNGRHMKRFMASRLPEMRRDLATGRDALERSRNRLIEELSA